MTQENITPTLNPKIVGEIELPKIDLKKYNGMKGVIKTVEFHEHAQNGLYAKVVTLPLGDTANNDHPVYATKVLGLFKQTNKETGEVSYGWGAETKTGLFLKKMEAKNFDDLVGQEVLIIHEVGKNNKQYLTF